jgi:hypothetical protein
MKYAIDRKIKFISISKHLWVATVVFYIDVILILEKIQHYFRKFPKIKSFSQRQSKGWLFGDYQMHFSSL